MGEGREKRGGEDDHAVSSPASSAAWMVDHASNGVRTTVGKEAEEEEAKIEEFFQLLRRVREARKELGIVKSTAAKRGTSVGREQLPWMPVFEVEDFAHKAKRLKADLGGGGGGGGGEDKAKTKKGKKDRELEVSTRLDLGLG